MQKTSVSEEEDRDACEESSIGTAPRQRGVDLGRTGKQDSMDLKWKERGEGKALRKEIEAEKVCRIPLRELQRLLAKAKKGKGCQ